LNRHVKIKETVIAYFKSKSDFGGQTEQDQLACAYLDERIIDSMGIVEMVTTFEVRFGITFAAQHMQMPEFRTIGGLIAMIEHLSQPKTISQVDPSA
jgi:acyl carrier protein